MVDAALYDRAKGRRREARKARREMVVSRDGMRAFVVEVAKSLVNAVLQPRAFSLSGRSLDRDDDTKSVALVVLDDGMYAE